MACVACSWKLSMTFRATSCARVLAGSWVPVTVDCDCVHGAARASFGTVAFIGVGRQSQCMRVRVLSQEFNVHAEQQHDFEHCSSPLQAGTSSAGPAQTKVKPRCTENVLRRAEIPRKKGTKKTKDQTLSGARALLPLVCGTGRVAIVSRGWRAQSPFTTSTRIAPRSTGSRMW